MIFLLSTKATSCFLANEYWLNLLKLGRFHEETISCKNKKQVTGHDKSGDGKDLHGEKATSFFSANEHRPNLLKVDGFHE